MTSSGWLYEGREVDIDIAEGHVGFVYLIENLINGKKYIGKKLFTSARSKKIKNSRRKKRFRVPSDWEKYYGSNKDLIADVEKHGSENFRRTILKLCQSKGECSYWEAKLQLECDAILRDDYYNQWVQCKIHKSHLK